MKVSVIVNTYNQPGYLELSLLSFFGQSCGGFEVVVADDGSGPDTAEVVEQVRREAPFPLRHVWHEDDGFRRTVILNKAVKAAAHDYVIITDGDCLAHRHFVRSHMECSGPGCYLAGRTPRLGRRVSARITPECVRNGRAQRVGPLYLWDYLFGDTTKLEFGFYAGNRHLFRWVQATKKKRDLWGGNFSFHRPDFVAVNGFNEEILGWGKEDAELDVRFRNFGLRPVSVANRAINFHLWHPKGDRIREVFERNLETKRDYERSGEYRCPVGYDGH